MPIRDVKIANTCTSRQGSDASTECVGKWEWLTSFYGPARSPIRNACIISKENNDLLLARRHMPGVGVIRLKCRKQELYWRGIITVRPCEDDGDLQVLEQPQGIMALMVPI